MPRCGRWSKARSSSAPNTLERNDVKKAILISVLAAACAGGCDTLNRSNTETGVVLGAAGGAILGAAAYSPNRTKGVLVGAVGGALAGGAVGAYMDSQKKDLEKNLAQEIKTRQARVE